MLVNNRFAYVSVSRAQRDVQIYTNDGGELSQRLSRDRSQRTATEVEEQPTAPQHRRSSQSLRGECRVSDKALKLLDPNREALLPKIFWLLVIRVIVEDLPGA